MRSLILFVKRLVIRLSSGMKDAFLNTIENPFLRLSCVRERREERALAFLCAQQRFDIVRGSIAMKKQEARTTF